MATQHREVDWFSWIVYSTAASGKVTTDCRSYLLPLVFAKIDYAAGS
jgi:hypothetical protein